MTDFTTSASLVVEPDMGSVRAARKKIEGELPESISVEVSGPSSAPTRTGGAGPASRAENGSVLDETVMADQTHSLASIDSSASNLIDLIRDQNSLLRGLQEDTESLAFEVAKGGLGGVGLTGLLSNIGGDAIGDALGESISDVISEPTDILGDVIGTGTGSLLGTALGESVSSLFLGGGSGSVSVEKPNWTPLAVKDPSPLGVKDPSPLGVNDPSPLSVETLSALDVKDPSPLGVKDPSPLAVKDPSPLGVNDPSPLMVDDPSPLSVETPSPLPVEEIDPIPVSVAVDISARSTTITSSPKSSGDSSPAQAVKDEPEKAGPVLDDIAEGATIGAITGGGTGAVVGSGAGGVGAVPGAVIGGVGGGLLGGTAGAISWGIDRAEQAGIPTYPPPPTRPRRRDSGEMTSTSGGDPMSDISVERDVTLVTNNDFDLARSDREIQAIVQRELEEFRRELERELRDSGR